jgi:hypothetical protein
MPVAGVGKRRSSYPDELLLEHLPLRDQTHVRDELEAWSPPQIPGTNQPEHFASMVGRLDPDTHQLMVRYFVDTKARSQSKRL